MRIESEIMAFFSVIIPLYNKEDDVEETLKSVINQSYKDFEVIIVNDGSTDNSLAVVEQVKDERIRIFSVANGGVSLARNYGVSEAKSEYVTFLDADDYWYPNHLQNLWDLINKFPEGRWFATAYEIMHNKRLTLPMSAPPMKNGENWMGEIDNFFKNSLRDCMAWTSAVCMRKDFFNELGRFDINLQVDQDIDLWVRASLQSNLHFSSKISAIYKLYGDNHISDSSILKRNVMDFDFYEFRNPTNQDLKVYLDHNRYSIAIRYKMAGDVFQSEKYVSAIKLKNLGWKKRVLLKTTRNILLFLVYAKDKMEVLGIRVRTS